MHWATTELHAELQAAFRRLERQVPPPIETLIGQHWFLRYKERGIEQALVQKLARCVSGLGAADVLLRKGYVQELGVIQRTLDELNEDILFLVIAVTDSGITPLHKRFLDAFWQEEYEDADDPVGTHLNRDVVPRKKIRAFLMVREVGEQDASTRIHVSKLLSKQYSGFVHGASPQIMDMCMGMPPRFRINGLRGTIRIHEHEDDILNYYWRGLLSGIGVAKAFGDAELVDRLMVVAHAFQARMNRDFGLRGVIERS